MLYETMQASGAPWPGGHVKSEEVSFYMPAPAVLIDGWACKIGGSFISHARASCPDRWVGMQNRKKLHIACPQNQRSKACGHAKSEKVSSRMPMKLKVKCGRHAKSEEASFHMPAKLKIKSRRASKIGRSFISYAHETKNQIIIKRSSVPVQYAAQSVKSSDYLSIM